MQSPHSNDSKRQKIDHSWSSVWNHVTESLPQSIQKLFDSPNFGYLTPVSSKTTIEKQHEIIDLDNSVLSPAVFGLRGGPISRLGNVSRRPSKALQHLIDKECRILANPDYMQTRQNGHFKKSRRSGIYNLMLIIELVFFMKGICLDFLFLDETFYIAVAYLDIYLSKVKVTQRKQFNLLALTCVFISAKVYEEILEPTCTEMANVAIDDHNIKDLKRMERKAIAALDWDFNIVTPHVF